MKFIQLVLVSSLAVALTSALPSNRKDGLRLIKRSENDPGKWMTEKEVFLTLIQKHEKFMDITDISFPQTISDAVGRDLPTSIRFPYTVEALIPRIDAERTEAFVHHFSSYRNRYYDSDTGIESQQWLFQTIQDAIVGYPGVATVEEFSHTWTQKSVVARIEGSDPTLKNEVVILGAHEDSINRLGGSLPAPGADDNASGCVLLKEALHVLIDSGFIPKRTIEFHWYAAEEIGLRGSGDMATTYRLDSTNVIAMINFDVVGYYTAEQIGIYTDFTNANLNAFLRLVVDEYCEWPWSNRVCGYGCSDHASWNSQGFPAAMPSEVVAHPQMHTESDTINNMRLNQVYQFQRLALGAVVELAEPAELRDSFRINI